VSLLGSCGFPVVLLMRLLNTRPFVSVNSSVPELVQFRIVRSHTPYCDAATEVESICFVSGHTISCTILDKGKGRGCTSLSQSDNC
jgi:hypothetical protein